MRGGAIDAVGAPTARRGAATATPPRARRESGRLLQSTLTSGAAASGLPDQSEASDSADACQPVTALRAMPGAHIKMKKPLHQMKRLLSPVRRYVINPGSDLLSHTPAHAVPSAVAGLTSVFGMGTGVTLPL